MRRKEEKEKRFGWGKRDLIYPRRVGSRTAGRKKNARPEEKAVDLQEEEVHRQKGMTWLGEGGRRFGVAWGVEEEGLRWLASDEGRKAAA